jgi:hypothetical protein
MCTRRRWKNPVSIRPKLIFAIVLGVLFAAPVLAAENEDGRIRVSAVLLDEIVRDMLPVNIVLPRSQSDPGANGAMPLALTELRYCGVTDKGAGKFRAVIRQMSTAKPTLPLLATNGACQHNLTDWVKRFADGVDGSEGVALADIEATWKPWELHLAIVRTADPPKGNRSRILAGLEKHRDLLIIPTADSRIDTKAGGQIVLAAVPSFAATSVEVTITWGGSGSMPSERTATETRGAQPAGEANAAADMALPFANKILRHLTWNQPLTIPVDRDEVDIQNVSLSLDGTGESLRLNVAGNATPRSIRETLRWTVALAGDPLRVSYVQVAGQMDDCAGRGTVAALACSVGNQARIVTAEAFGSVLTRKYQGQLVHELASPMDLRLSVASQPLEVRGNLLRMRFGPRGLSATARLSPNGR